MRQAYTKCTRLRMIVKPFSGKMRESLAVRRWLDSMGSLYSLDFVRNRSSKLFPTGVMTAGFWDLPPSHPFHPDSFALPDPRETTPRPPTQQQQVLSINDTTDKKFHINLESLTHYQEASPSSHHHRLPPNHVEVTVKDPRPFISNNSNTSSFSHPYLSPYELALKGLAISNKLPLTRMAIQNVISRSERLQHQHNNNNTKLDHILSNERWSPPTCANPLAVGRSDPSPRRELSFTQLSTLGGVHRDDDPWLSNITNKPQHQQQPSTTTDRVSNVDISIPLLNDISKESLTAYISKTKSKTNLNEAMAAEIGINGIKRMIDYKRQRLTHSFNGFF